MIPGQPYEADNDMESGAAECLTTGESSSGHVNSGHVQSGKGHGIQSKCIQIALDIPKICDDIADDASQAGDVVKTNDKIPLMRALVAEAIGTGTIILVGCGSVCANLSGAYQGIWQVAIVWGFGVSLAIYSTADISGAHLNPAITLAFRLIRPTAHGMTWFKSFLYVVAQMVGAILAAMLNLAIYSDTLDAFERENHIVRGDPRSILTAAAFGEYFPNPQLSQEWGNNRLYANNDISVGKALFVEAFGTMSLAFVIFGLTNKHNLVGLGAGAPFMIGAAIAVNFAIYAPITQAGCNPARDFGPRLVAFFAGWNEVAIPGPKSGFWVYIVGPCIGAPLGAAVADWLLWRPVPTKEV